MSSGDSTLGPAAKSFTTWGFEHGESLSLDQDDPAVGDAVVFYPPGTTQAQIENSNPDDYPADHVGIVASVNSNGTVWASGEEWV